MFRIMSFVNEHEKRAIASVGTTHAASLLARFTKTPAAHHPNGGAEAHNGQRISRDTDDATVISLSLRDIAREQATLHLRTKQISKPAEKGPSPTIRPLVIVQDFLAYVLRKSEGGTVRIRLPTTLCAVDHCPAPIKWRPTHVLALH